MYNVVDVTTGVIVYKALTKDRAIRMALAIKKQYPMLNIWVF